MPGVPLVSRLPTPSTPQSSILLAPGVPLVNHPVDSEHTSKQYSLGAGRPLLATSRLRADLKSALPRHWASVWGIDKRAQWCLTFTVTGFRHVPSPQVRWNSLSFQTFHLFLVSSQSELLFNRDTLALYNTNLGQEKSQEEGQDGEGHSARVAIKSIREGVQVM